VGPLYQPVLAARSSLYGGESVPVSTYALRLARTGQQRPGDSGAGEEGGNWATRVPGHTCPRYVRGWPITGDVRDDSAVVSGAGTLPMPPTPLVGREDALTLVDAALATHEFRLVTLTGPPGVGKTHLALVAAAAAAARFADGAVFVDLSGAHHLRSFLGEVGRAIGSSEVPGRPVPERLADTLADRELLLVIDNCEHFLPVPELGAMLAQCPRVRVLATSRERLRLAAERELPVAPLAVPDGGDVDDLERVAASPAVRLLVARARAVQHDFAVTPQNARDVADVCIRLDGLPLALELAAAQLKVFTPGELAYQLRHRSILIAGGHADMPSRHQGLRTAISWSHNLMPDVERTLFRRLAVFVGGWTLPAAEAVCTAPIYSGQPIDVTAATPALVDKSVIRRSTRPDGVTVFSMLDSIREYAAEQLAEHAEEVATRRRHAAFYAKLAVQAEEGIGTAAEDMWWDWLGYEHGNLRSALDFSLEDSNLTTALWLAAALGWYWYTRGYVGEGRTIISRMLGTDGVDSAQAEPVAAVLLVGGILAWSHGDSPGAMRLLGRSRRMSEDVGDLRRVANASAFLGHVARESGDHAAAAGHYGRARDIHEDAANERGAAWAQFDLGLLAWRRGDLEEAATLLQASLSRFRGLGYEWAIAWSAWALAGVEAERGRDDVAGPLAADALEKYERTDDRRGLAQCLELIAQIAVLRGRESSAGRLLGAAATIRRALAAPGTKTELAVRTRAETTVVRSLGSDRADRAQRAGRALPTSDVLALARRIVGSVTDGSEHTTARPTPREREVAALVAAGHTNREIGRTLGITEKTAEVHVRNVMGKLGVRSRAEIATWAVSHGIYEPEPS
jgi:predicted ATPase/DNA-binding CsgD family transcriptional regulator